MVLKIKGKIPLSKQISELSKNSKIKLKLPFTATGFKAKNKPFGITAEDVEKGKKEIILEDIPKIIAKPVKKYKEKLEAINGIGKELAEEIIEKYPNWETFVNKVTVEDLVEIAGIGKRRAKKIMKQLEE